MDPFRPITIDARMPSAQFLDGGPITDGIANLIASAINAPVAAGQIRRQRQMDDRQMARQAQQDQLAKLWRGQDTARQGRQDALAAEFQKAQIGNMQMDNARQMAGMFGSGLNNAAARGIDAVKAIGNLFGGGRARSNGSTGAPRQDKPEVRNFGTDVEPNWRQWNGKAWMPIELGAAATEGEAPAVADAEPVDTGASVWRDRVLNLNAFGNPVALLSRLWGARPERGANWTPAPGEIEQEQPPVASPAPAAARQFTPGQQAAITATSNSMRRGAPPPQAQPAAPRPPEWEAAKIDQGGLDSWHQMAKQNPQEFKRQLTQLRASNDPRYPIIIAELRKRTGK